VFGNQSVYLLSCLRLTESVAGVVANQDCGKYLAWLPSRRFWDWDSHAVECLNNPLVFGIAKDTSNKQIWQLFSVFFEICVTKRTQAVFFI
jgi:hypothetical protein